MSLQRTDTLELSPLYFYGFRGRSMVAARAPYAMADNARELIGRIAKVAGHCYRIVAIERQSSGPVSLGEPIGLEIAHTADAPA